MLLYIGENTVMSFSENFKIIFKSSTRILISEMLLSKTDMQVIFFYQNVIMH